MYSLELTKEDGRSLTLYGRRAPAPHGVTPSPFAEAMDANPHLRWHPLRGEWVTYAAHRQERTFLPPPDYDPLAVTSDQSRPTELPAGEWDVAVFDNRFPALTLTAHTPPDLTVATAPGFGKCEMVVYTQDAGTSLGGLPLTHVELLLAVWADRTKKLGALAGIEFVLPFENRGVEVGATLHHAHGQIYAYPTVPPVPANMQRVARDYFDAHSTGIFQDLIRRELGAAERLIFSGADAIAFVPPCARYPYEVWVAPLEPVASLPDLNAAQRRDLARALKTVVLKYDGLWGREFPYVMACYQAPSDGEAHPESHLHFEFYPPYRTPTRLKYLAGTELAAGFFAMDALPESKARELQAVEVLIE